VFSLATEKAGCQVFAVDHQANRFTPKVPAFTVVLSLEIEDTTANQMLEFLKLDAVHFGLMCGTCNNAGQIILIGNPVHSWLWPLLAILVAQTAKEEFIIWYFSLEATMFQTCMQFEVCINGFSHNQSTIILDSPGVFNSLAVQCGHSHSHEPWPAKKLDDQGWVSDTAAKAEYPANIAGPSQHAHAQQYRALQQHFEASHWLPADAKPVANGEPLPPKTAGEEVEVAAAVRSSRGHLHGRGLKVGVGTEPEFRVTKELYLHHPMDTTIAQLDPLDKALLAALTKEPAVRVRDCLEMLRLYKALLAMLTKEPAVLVGDCLEMPRLYKALLTMLTKEPEVLARDRLEMLKLYGDRAADLLAAETELHNKLLAHGQGAVQGKRLMLFGECLKAHSFPGMRVVHVFTEDNYHESGHVDRLVELSQEEVVELLLKEPFFLEEEVSTELGMTFWTLTSSFLLVRGDDGKERTIDGYRRRPDDTALHSRLHLGQHYVKVAPALETRLICLLRVGPHVPIQLRDGTGLRGGLSRTARSDKAFLWGCFDLPKAYKQLATSVRALGVHSFDEITRALQVLLWEDLGTQTTDFYDGHPTFYFTVAAMNTTQVVSGFPNAWSETCSECKGSETLNRGLQWAKLYSQKRGGTRPWQWEQPFPLQPRRTCANTPDGPQVAQTL